MTTTMTPRALRSVVSMLAAAVLALLLCGGTALADEGAGAPGNPLPAYAKFDSAAETFEIIPRPIEPTIALSQNMFAYNGKVQKPEVTVWNGEDELVAGEDYEVSFSGGCKNLGTYTATVTLKGAYSGSASAEFMIVTSYIIPKVVLSPATLPYNGSVQAPEVTVLDSNDEPIAAEDYEVTFPDNSMALGTYTIAVTMKGGYGGNGSATFEIVAKAIEPRVVLSPSSFTYDGTAKTPEIAVWDGEVELVADEDYDAVIPANCTDIGTYAVTVTLKGVYAGSAEATFQIAAKEATPTVTLSPSTFTYDGKVKTPKVTVKEGEDVLVEGEDYDVVLPGDRKNVGSYTVQVIRKGNYVGSASAQFTIAKAANTLSAKAGKTLKVKASKLKKGSVKISRTKAMKVSKAQGTLSYKLGGVSKKKYKKYFKVNAKTGAITVKKGLKKGKYTVSVKVKAAGTKNYKPLTKTVKVKITVK